MSTFKVISKANGWQKSIADSKIITVYKFFGLIKSKKIVFEKEKVPGPAKEEICIVTDTYMDKETLCYILSGYPYGGYDSKYFVRLDEFTETQKEIAEKSEKVLN